MRLECGYNGYGVGGSKQDIMQMYNEYFCYHFFYDFICNNGARFAVFIFDHDVFWTCDIRFPCFYQLCNFTKIQYEF